ncbi:hypothetical protein ACO0K2_17405 [Undibacterium sp. MH2W]
MRIFIEQLRQWLVVMGVTLCASSFYAVIPAALVRYFFDLDPEVYGWKLALFIWLPIFSVLAIFFYPRVRKHLGFD